MEDLSTCLLLNGQGVKKKKKKKNLFSRKRIFTQTKRSTTVISVMNYFTLYYFAFYDSSCPTHALKFPGSMCRARLHFFLLFEAFVPLWLVYHDYHPSSKTKRCTFSYISRITFIVSEDAPSELVPLCLPHCRLCL